MMRLHYARGSCSLASHIALEEAGADYHLHRVDFAAAEQRGAAYLAINPKGRVPALETPHGVLTENPAILAYIAETHPAAGLTPPPSSFAYARMQAFNLFLCATLHPAFAHRFRAERYADGEDHIAAVKAKAPEAVALHFALVEQALADGRTWVHGEGYGLSDAYLYVFTRWLHRDGMGGSERFPFARAHMQRVDARPAVQRVLAAEGDTVVGG